MDSSFLQASGCNYENTVMKMFRSTSHQEINFEPNEAFVLLKLREQLEKLEREV